MIERVPSHSSHEVSYIDQHDGLFCDSLCENENFLAALELCWQSLNNMKHVSECLSSLSLILEVVDVIIGV